jgi:hypothetical protein
MTIFLSKVSVHPDCMRAACASPSFRHREIEAATPRDQRA